jgi:hypothetical protein
LLNHEEAHSRVAAGTVWKIREFIDSDGSLYIAAVEKTQKRALRKRSLQSLIFEVDRSADDHGR